MDEKKLQSFIQWLPTKFEEFQNKTPDEIAQSLNTLYKKGKEGQATLQSMWQTFEQEDNTQTSMFKAGGKLDMLVQKYAKGGKRKSKKCACGCELIMKKAKGGIIEECACGCKVGAYQKGGDILSGRSDLNIKGFRQGAIKELPIVNNRFGTTRTFKNNSSDLLEQTVSPNLQDTTYTSLPFTGNSTRNPYNPTAGSVFTNNDNWFQRLIGQSNKAPRQTLNKLGNLFEINKRK